VCVSPISTPAASRPCSSGRYTVWVCDPPGAPPRPALTKPNPPPSCLVFLQALSAAAARQRQTQMGDGKKMGKGEAAAAEAPTYEELTAGLPPRSLWQGGAG